jgi:hypothetical protein
MLPNLTFKGYETRKGVRSKASSLGTAESDKTDKMDVLINLQHKLAMLRICIRLLSEEEGYCRRPTPFQGQQQPKQ